MSPAPTPAAATAGVKLFPDAASALHGLVADGQTLAVGGFGLCGVPQQLIEALHAAGTTDLQVVSNNCGVDQWGLGVLLGDHRIARMTSSYVGENKEFARQFLSGELEVELTPQGTLAERLRAGGAGIPAFFTATGVGTQVAEGGLPWRYGPDGSVTLASPAKETRELTVAGETRTYVLEESIVTDFALVHAWKGDRSGNLVYRESARNFNPLCATAGKVTIAQVEHLVEVGEIRPEEVHTPGVFVQRVVDVGPDLEKRIERRTTRPRPGSVTDGGEG
jgi:3-oxoacid CoA-transferase subunit A